MRNRWECVELVAHGVTHWAETVPPGREEPWLTAWTMYGAGQGCGCVVVDYPITCKNCLRSKVYRSWLETGEEEVEDE